MPSSRASPNGVRLLFEAMAEQGRDARALANAVAAIGPGTAASLAEHGVIADVVPQRFVAEALVEALASVDVHDRPVLVARAAEARDVLPDTRRARRRVDVVALDGPRGSRPGRDRGRRRRGHHLYLVLDGPQPAGRHRRPLPAIGPGWSRSARSPARRRARPAWRCTSRPGATTRRAWSRR